ncbi:hypothetical protein BG011_000886 [Mortierella polycephala]|uniref:Sphingomyelin synthase-like domain-containing protein n=1 Tax=Mortierella polycephala TaxID=41804 RepID=A0A9P6TV30_9FUNG|nr:hypothetical protein BG011_000886 [Mortierella polycephala]
MEPQLNRQSIQIEPLQGDLDHPQQRSSNDAYNAYTMSESFEDETDLDRINRNSNTSTLVCSSPQHSRPNHARTFSSTSLSTKDIKISTTAKKSNNNSNEKGRWYRFTHSESGRLVCAFLYFTVVCIGMAFCNQLSDHRWVETQYTDVLLSDRGFDVIPALADIQPANTFVMTSVLFTVFGIGLICPDWTKRAIVLRRILWVIGTLSAFRSLTLSVTTLPTPKEGCQPSLKTGFWDMFIIALEMIPGTVEACTDDIFSGHSVFMVTCAIQWRLYCKNKWVTYFSYLYISIGLYFVVATRLHYTVDVVLAVFITFAGWSVYMAMVDVVMEEEYFGIKSHHEKYVVFDGDTTEYEFPMINHQDEEECPGNGTRVICSRRTQLQYRMNRLRGPRIGYGLGEHDRVAFVPMQFNLWLVSLIRWCDGLDLRMRPTESPSSHFSEKEEEGLSRWQQLVVRHRIERMSKSGTATVRNQRKVEGYFEEEEDEDSRLDSARMYDYTNDEERQNNRGRWRSLPLREASSRPRNRVGRKEDKESGKDRSRKLQIHILKISILILVNVILVIKAVQMYQDRVSANTASHWPQDKDAAAPVS